jgi:hypothetical protein
MIERGYTNVKTVQGGGRAMEKFFDHYGKTYDGGKITNPRTGQVIDIKSKK